MRPVQTSQGCSTRAAFTLLELMVVATLMTLVTAISAQFWRYFSVQLTDVSQRSTAAQELQFAVESLRADLGMVRQVTAVTQTRMRIYTGPAGNEEEIDYWLEGKRLFRQDVATGQSVPLAGNVSEFQVQNITPTSVRIVTAVTRGSVVRRATMIWSAP
ncbi:MAG: type II secretion system GspH family protein [Planctomycetaceae bacterium]|nr:type II secretion system GspH family protein [Planctomycetaceae bacterium]